MPWKTIGIVGGLSPESTVEYYRHITRSYTEKFGDHGYPEIIVYSVTFQSYLDWLEEDRWDLIASALAQAARQLEAAGADFVIIATNTMHLVLHEVRARVDVHVLSLIDAVCEAVTAQEIGKVGLLGTRFTMESSLYKDPLKRSGVAVLVPDADDRAYVNRVIHEELDAGLFLDSSRQRFVAIVEGLRRKGAQGVILGCTEIPLLVREQDADVPLFDTTAIHAAAALSYALDGKLPGGESAGGDS